MISKRLAKGLAAFAVLALCSTSALAMKIDILVNKVSQRMTVSVDGVPTYQWLVSTGGEGYDTPSGKFRIFRMEKEHFSEEWDNAPMPYSMFFTGIGHAIHGSYHVKRLGTRASHGCVRLAPENAAVLFGLMTKAGFKNNSVVIKGGFFDSEQLTTEQTFNMTPNSRSIIAGRPDPNPPLFWWTRKSPTKKVVDNFKPVSGKKKKKKPFNLFGAREG